VDGWVDGWREERTYLLVEGAGVSTVLVEILFLMFRTKKNNFGSW
jgi:hypothetical protein